MVDLNIKLPQGFLEEEERSGYKVSKEKKGLWAVQLDLLEELLRVCEKHNIKVIADSGTLLGCVRHKGYIPWDDDIDVYLTRDDYTKLCGLKDEFKEGYFFQNCYTDSILRYHGQLRKNGTTALIKYDYGMKYHRGVFIDIFILDYVPENEEERNNFANELYSSFKKLVKPTLKHFMDNDSIVKKCMKAVWNICFLPFKKLGFKLKYKNVEALREGFKKWEALVSKYNHKTKYVSNISCYSTSKEKVLYFEESMFNDLILLDFEMFKLYCPRDYDTRLKEEYGDWHKFVIGTTTHGSLYFNVDKDYKEFDSISYKEFKKLFQ